MAVAARPTNRRSVKALSALTLRCLLCVLAAISPVRTPRTKYPRARFFFLRITAEPMKPPIAATPATATNRSSCSSPAALMMPDQTTADVGPEVRADCCDQTEDEALPQTKSEPPSTFTVAPVT
jgi:hypothetical protein